MSRLVPLIESEFCSAATIINCHAGLVPESRGLDAFKWAIYHGRPLGNTLHIIDQNIERCHDDSQNTYRALALSVSLSTKSKETSNAKL